MNQRKHFENGDIVYFVKTDRFGMRVAYGMVYDEFADGVCVDFLSPKETRIINGIPLADFKTPTKWEKLPKNWTYNTKLFIQTNEKINCEEIKNLNIKNPSDIKKAYDLGFLVLSSSIDHCVIRDEISKEGWRIIREYPMWQNNPTSTTLNHWEVYTTYDEAQKFIDDYNAELIRQSNLTDEEWSIENIEKCLNRYNNIYHKESYVDRCRDIIMNLSNIEDVETRISDGVIQWKYWNNKRWNSI